MYYVNPYISFILDVIVFDDLSQLMLVYRRVINVFLIMATNSERHNVDTVNYFNKLAPVSAIRVNFSFAIKHLNRLNVYINIMINNETRSRNSLDSLVQISKFAK